MCSLPNRCTDMPLALTEKSGLRKHPKECESIDAFSYHWNCMFHCRCFGTLHLQPGTSDTLYYANDMFHSNHYDGELFRCKVADKLKNNWVCFDLLKPEFAIQAFCVIDLFRISFRYSWHSFITTVKGAFITVRKLATMKGSVTGF